MQDTSTKTISLVEFYRYLHNPRELSLEIFNYKELYNSYKFLLSSEKSFKKVYGYNTGFGALGNKKISNYQKKISQKNLIYHLATGVGERFSDEEVLAIVLARIFSLAKGLSGISLESFKKLIYFFQNQVIAHIPQVGTVGASGDLTPLAHLVLSYMGEGCIYSKGKYYPKDEFFKANKILPLRLKGRDGLAIVNGTSASCGISILNFFELEKLFRICIFYSFIYGEIFQLSFENYSTYLYSAKPHEGFFKLVNLLKELIHSSPRISQKFFSKSNESLQPHYSLRASIQVLGSVYDFLKKYYEILEVELNSVSDNPLIFANDKHIVHGANFYGAHLSLVSDGMKLLTHQIANLSERRIAKLTDSKQNSLVPPFLIQKSLGLNSGFMGAQVTATAILAEIRSLTNPISSNSIPTNANNQDIIPVACTAARFTRKGIKLLYELLSIEGLCLAQSIEILGVQKFSKQTQSFIAWIRKTSKFLYRDRPLSDEIQKISQRFKNEKINWNFEFLF